MTHSENLTSYRDLVIGDRVTGPGRRPSSPREAGTLVELYRLTMPRSTGIFAKVQRDDGQVYTTAVGLVAKATR